MRMRRKKNLFDRLLEDRSLLIAFEGNRQNVNEFIKEKEYIDFKSVFNNSNPVEMDIGTGCGGFAIKSAKVNPNINLIGVEQYSNVLLTAIDNVKDEKIDNLKFMNCRVECLEKYILPHTISRIYLNFSNPLNNTTEEKQRLTYKRFLDIYKYLLVEDGAIFQKTDNLQFFEYSLKSFEENGFKLKNVCYDLVNNPIENNIQTEHEKKYIERGEKIYRLEAYLQ